MVLVGWWYVSDHQDYLRAWKADVPLNSSCSSGTGTINMPTLTHTWHKVVSLSITTQLRFLFSFCCSDWPRVSCWQDKHRARGPATILCSSHSRWSGNVLMKLSIFYTILHIFTKVTKWNFAVGNGMECNCVDWIISHQQKICQHWILKTGVSQSVDRWNGAGWDSWVRSEHYLYQFISMIFTV